MEKTYPSPFGGAIGRAWDPPRRGNVGGGFNQRGVRGSIYNYAPGGDFGRNGQRFYPTPAGYMSTPAASTPLVGQSDAGQHPLPVFSPHPYFLLH